MKNKFGVENKQTVDLITHDLKSDEIVLILIERRKWDGSIERMQQLQEKINNYLTFALDGQMVKRYPESIDKPLRIQLDTPELPDADTRKFLDKVEDKLKGEGIKFLVNIVE